MSPNLATLITAADTAKANLAAAVQAVADADASRATAGANHQAALDALKQVETDIHAAVVGDYGEPVVPVVAEAATAVAGDPPQP